MTRKHRTAAALTWKYGAIFLESTAAADTQLKALWMPVAGAGGQSEPGGSIAGESQTAIGIARALADHREPRAQRLPRSQRGNA